jgi:hypothetical protein
MSPVVEYNEHRSVASSILCTVDWDERVLQNFDVKWIKGKKPDKSTFRCGCSPCLMFLLLSVVF